MAPKRAPSNAHNKPAGDFKRLKAKVGKRAPARINATNTLVKTSTIKVNAQASLMGYKTLNTTQAAVDYDDTFGTAADDNITITTTNTAAAAAPIVHPTYANITALPPIPNSGSKPLSLLLSLATSHSSVKTRLQLLKTLTQFLLNEGQSQDPSFHINISDLHAPTFTPPLLSLLLPVLQTTLLDTTPHPTSQTEVLPPTAPLLLTAFLAFCPNPPATLAPHIPQLLAYILAGLTSLAGSVIHASLTTLKILLSLPGNVVRGNERRILECLGCLKKGKLMVRGKWGGGGRYELSLECCMLVLKGYERGRGADNLTLLVEGGRSTVGYDYDAVCEAFVTILGEEGIEKGEEECVLEGVLRVVQHGCDVGRYRKAFKRAWERGIEGEGRVRTLAVLGAIEDGCVPTVVERYLRGTVEMIVCRRILDKEMIDEADRVRVFSRLAEGDVMGWDVVSVCVSYLERNRWFEKAVMAPASTNDSIQLELVRVGRKVFKNVCEFTFGSEQDGEGLRARVLELCRAVIRSDKGMGDEVFDVLMSHLKPDILPVAVMARKFLALNTEDMAKVVKVCKKGRAWECVIGAAKDLNPGQVIQFVVSVLGKKGTGSTAAGIVLTAKGRLGWAAIPNMFVGLGGWVAGKEVKWQVDYMVGLWEGGERSVGDDAWGETLVGAVTAKFVANEDGGVEDFRGLVKVGLGRAAMSKLTEVGDGADLGLIDRVVRMFREQAGEEGVEELLLQWVGEKDRERVQSMLKEAAVA